ncbi:sodium-dependent proline transporter-like [Haliotis cracherodii]|uniref:sodium-dependent proline transporter-like n=1 Tax=Haliotis cracherodii TaxID=6455 RepID=UPI0039E9805C
MGNKEVDVEDRGGWSGKLDFLLSCIGYAVGLGNVWRFPYLAYKHGGASFLIPYVIMLVLAGLPIFFFELALGQFASEGPITVWKVSPIFTGAGYAMVITSAVVAIYYNVIIMYAIYYMFVSFVNLDDKLPWETCNNDFNTKLCRREAFTDLSGANETFSLGTLYDEKFNSSCVRGLVSTVANKTMMADLTFDTVNSTLLTGAGKYFEECKIRWTTASAEYWALYVTRYPESDGIGSLGPVSLKNIICLLFAWILIFFCLMKGIKSSGKVVYFTATFPYIVLVVLLIRGLTLPGYEKGIKFYIIPVWERLLNPSVWGDAAAQIFYSLGPGFGGLLTMASYNKFKNNCYRDAIIVALINCGTSVFAGFAIFSLLGFMAYQSNVEVSEVADEGVGLAFIAYPEGISRLPVAPLWAFLFFFMLLTLGMDSQFAMMETVISGISDVFPQYLRKRKTPFTLICCIIGFLLGIPIVTYGGLYVLTLMNWYSGSYNLFAIGFCELFCISYVYGIKRFMCDIEMMLGFKPNVYWWAMWTVLTPLTILFIIIISAYNAAPAGYNDYTFEPWAQGVGWMMSLVPVAVIIVTALVQVKRLGFRNSLKPTADWGPADPANRTGRYADMNSVDIGSSLAYISKVNEAFETDDLPLKNVNGTTPQDDTLTKEELSSSYSLRL